MSTGPTENQILQLVQNTITGVIRRIGHQLEDENWKAGPVAYGYHDGNTWHQDCIRQECDWRFGIRKELDIRERTVFIVEAVILGGNNRLLGMADIKESHTLFEVTLGSDLVIVGDYLSKNKVFQLDEKLTSQFILGAKHCLCKRLTNFI